MTQSENSRESNYIRGFDGIRAIAVIIVIMGHGNISGPLLREHHPIAFNLLAAPRGVDIFFVLSGFLITILLLQERHTFGQVNLGNFFIRRAFRLLPLYYLYCAALVIFSLFVATGFRWDGLPYLVLNIFNFAPKVYRTAVNGHIWSLSVEWHFYLFWPIIFCFFSRGRLIPVAALVALVCACMLAIEHLPRDKAYNYMSWTIPAACPIVIGALAAMLLDRNRYVPFIALPVGVLLYVLPALYSLPISGSAVRATGIALVILWIFCNQNSRLVSALEISPLRFIGVISYGLYVWHGFFMGTGPSRRSTQIWPPNQLAGFVLTVIVAPLSYYYFERPIQALQKRFLRPKNSPASSQN